MITLGNKYKDSVTGYEGLAVSRTEYINGCTQIGLQARIDKDGKVPKIQFFDEQDVDPESKAKVGGPATAPPPRATPS